MVEHSNKCNYWRRHPDANDLLAMLVAAAIGLAGTSGVSAVPVNGGVIGDFAKATDPVAQV